MIPRDQVAAALRVSADDLPPGDLPLPRLAARFIDYLREAFAAEAPHEHAEYWTFLLFSRIAETQPDLALDIVLAALELCETPEDTQLIVTGPMEDLVSADPRLAARIDELAASNPKLGAALSGS